MRQLPNVAPSPALKRCSSNHDRLLYLDLVTPYSFNLPLEYLLPEQHLQLRSSRRLGALYERMMLPHCLHDVSSARIHGINAILTLPLRQSLSLSLHPMMLSLVKSAVWSEGFAAFRKRNSIRPSLSAFMGAELSHIASSNSMSPVIT